MTDSSDRFALSHRAAVAGLFAAPALSLRDAAARTGENPTPRTAFSCIATPQAVDGPYYFDAKMLRADITENHPGAPLQIRFVVMDVATCQPLAGARVDIWHARADGLYSGYNGQGDDHAIDTSGGTFMRGTQTSDSQGEVRFRTVYPGWYEGRTTHIHFKVFTNEKNVLTGQMYFPDALSQYLYANVNAYARKGRRDTFNADDGLALMDKTHGGFCDIGEKADHYLATLILGVDRAAPVLANRFGLPDMPPGAPPSGRPPGPPPFGMGPPPGLMPGMRPHHQTVTAIVPGVAPKDQKNG
ncbi:intradiol ring-cleavage dioxygenase [Tardiphaga robiniae]|nr:intradiol ring-cleavage dioxygenase [Tardiphaga robiniae]